MTHSGSEEYRELIGEVFDHATTLVVRHLPDPHRLGLTTSSVLGRLEEESPVRLTALAAGAGVSQPSMTGLIQRLTRQGLVTRVSDPADGRATLIGITDAGRALLAERRRARHAELADLLETLSPEDEAALALAMRVALPIVRRLLRSTTVGEAGPSDAQ